MAETVIVQFTPTPQDYMRANRGLLAQRRSTWIWLLPFVLVMLWLVWSLMGPALSGERSGLEVVGLLLPPLAIMAGVLAGVLWWIPYRAGRAARNNERLLAPITWELGEEQVLMKSRFSETKFDWGSFRSLTEDRDYFFLRLSAASQLYNFIPRRAFTSAAHEAQFREMVTRHIGRA